MRTNRYSFCMLAVYRERTSPELSLGTRRGRGLRLSLSETRRGRAASGVVARSVSCTRRALTELVYSLDPDRSKWRTVHRMLCSLGLEHFLFEHPCHNTKCACKCAAASFLGDQERWLSPEGHRNRGIEIVTNICLENPSAAGCMPGFLRAAGFPACNSSGFWESGADFARSALFRFGWGGGLS